MPAGSELDAARTEVVERGLTGEAIGALIALVRGFSLEALGPVKQQLKRYFSLEPWTAEDDARLAAAVERGLTTRTPMSGSDPIDEGRAELAPGVRLVWACPGGTFTLRVESDTRNAPASDVVSPPERDGVPPDLAVTFDGVVVPEATPSPRTIRFATPPLAGGASRAYDSDVEAVAEPAAARLFRDFPDVTNVLVGPDFVAVTASRPDRWESLLVPVLRAVTEEFTEGEAAPPATNARGAVNDLGGASSGDTSAPDQGRLARAWRELGSLRADRPEHLARISAALDDAEAPRRQVAAVLLADAPPEDATRAWARLLDDPSRTVRRAVVDTMADAQRAELRPLLERALDDTDAWVRWKALRGIAAIGVDSSRARLDALATDPDFRVRLDAGRITADLG